MAKRILIVEDNAWNARLIGDILESLNRFDILEAANGVQAMEMIRKESPDLILLDIMLPDKNGVEVLKEIKADASLAKIPVIALTASASADLQRQSEEAGSAAFLTKPFTKRGLLAVVEKLLPDS
jgi:CheY-like chemotaxis protein